MKKSSGYALVLSVPFLLAGAVWQASRFSALAKEARRLEVAQEAWVEANGKLLGSIAVLESRERAAQLAAELGLEKAGPGRRLLIAPPRFAGREAQGGRGGADG